jgi:hypothetical protein
MWLVGVMTKKEAKELKKAGYDIRKVDRDGWDKILEPKRKVKSDTARIEDPVEANLYSIWTEADAYEELKKCVEEDKAYKEMKRRVGLRYEREMIADTRFERATKACLDIPNDTEVVDHEGWEYDGGDRFMKKFYYSNEEWETSRVGSFIVDFKPDSNKIESIHSNT